MVPTSVSTEDSRGVVKYECPSFDPSICLFAKPGRAECRNDSQCTSPKKCCCSNCGWKCMDPVKVKTGRCPLVFAKCRMPYPKPTCHKDSDCPGLKKCCSICGYNCWDPAPEPPGVCPKNDGETLSELQCSSVQCSRDTDCRANEKCCTSGGEQKCVEPEVKYECPYFDPAICLFAKPGRAECRNDSQCTSPKKCCCSNCGWKCMDPVEVKTGRCPLVFAKCRMPYPKPTCHKDSDCPGLKKCCSICGYNCWDPAPEPPGVCPKNDGETLSELQCSSVQCSRDTDCGANEKCCTSGDEQKCVEPVVHG
ncbi:whey acidic protein-like isoform X2 [Hyla sarda]|uniref:whey acidic protein-like isoform X2 n=1 Tax=Hyla sarda TaxID=327740 RepID=UPI0024C2758F|nr:whey acidic protein-like isoform X2 [Hyla sarda]